MNSIYKLLYLSLIIVFWSCTRYSQTEKYQNKRDNIVNVREKVKEIEMEDVLIGQTARLYTMGNYLIIGDYRTSDKYIHLFDKNTFRYLTSTANRGQGPGEIANMGHIEADESNRVFYVCDHGKQRIFSYNLDSVLADPLYTPEVKTRMDKGQFPSKYQYINDTLCIGLIIEPVGNADFRQSAAKWNMNTGDITPMKYKHPDIEKKRVCLAVSVEKGIYAECYEYHDLMTVCNFQGDLKYNVYGPGWSSRRSEIHHYGKAVFCNERILASYSGGERLSNEYNPTKFFVFDINGDYIQTLETEYRIIDYCYDKENNRIVMALDDAEIQFAYLELAGLIK